MPFELSIAAPDLDNEDLQTLTHDLARTINQETDFRADLPEESGGVGSKGDVGLLGQIALTLLGSGGVAVALIGVLRSYFERSRALEIELTREDGRKLKISGAELSPERIEELIPIAQRFFEGK